MLLCSLDSCYRIVQSARCATSDCISIQINSNLVLTVEECTIIDGGLVQHNGQCMWERYILIISLSQDKQAHFLMIMK